MRFARATCHFPGNLVDFRIEATLSIHLSSNDSSPLGSSVDGSTMKSMKLLLGWLVLSIPRHDCWYYVDLRVMRIVLGLGDDAWLRRRLGRHVVVDTRRKCQRAFEFLAQLLSELVDFQLSVFMVREKSIDYVIDSVLFGELGRFRVNRGLERARRLFLCNHLLMLHLLLDHLF